MGILNKLLQKSRAKAVARVSLPRMAREDPTKFDGILKLHHANAEAFIEVCESLDAEKIEEALALLQAAVQVSVTNAQIVSSPVQFVEMGGTVETLRVLDESNFLVTKYLPTKERPFNSKGAAYSCVVVFCLFRLNLLPPGKGSIASHVMELLGAAVDAREKERYLLARQR